MNAKAIEYEKLEMLPAGSLSANQPPRVGQAIKSLMGQITKFLAPENGPKVRSHSLATGEIRFNAYDPVTQRRLQNRSEEELRIWLEQRYHAKSRQDLR